MGRLVHGVGYNDVDYVTQKFISETVNGVRSTKQTWVCPYYRKWKDMLKRCYYQTDFPTYKECYVSEDWLLFSRFRTWCIQQEFEYSIDIGTLQLDKDLLVEGNKEYCKECCVFVDNKVNTFILDSKKIRGDYLIGACLNKTKTKYESWCRSIHDRKQEYLGVYTYESEAHEAWRKRKHQHSCYLANSEYVIDNRVKKTLLTKYHEDFWYSK